jgi:transcriptional regulator with XRE-family HTH domain
MLKTIDKKTIAQRLKAVRAERGVTQATVAIAIGIDRSGYSYIERGDTFPSIPTLGHLADYFEVSLDYLCGRDSYLIEVE